MPSSVSASIRLGGPWDGGTRSKFFPSIDELGVLLVEVLMGHDVGGTCVHLVTPHLHAVVVGALPIEVAAVVVDAAIVQRAEAHEAVLQGVVSLLVHVVMSDHVLLACEPLVVALWVQTVIVLAVLVGAMDVAAVLTS